MAKTFQEIIETFGKVIKTSFTVMRKSGNSYTSVADISSEEIAESRYYFDGALYSSVMRCLEVKLVGNRTETVKKGLVIDDFELEATHPEGDSIAVKYGRFIIAEEPEYDAAQNVTSIIAYDELYPSMQLYALTLDWSKGITLKNYLKAILDKLGISYDDDSFALMANADLLITSEKFIDIENDDTESAYTYRDVLDEIAKAAGVSFAFINSLGGDEHKLYALKPTESGYVIDESNLKSVTIGAKYGPVRGVVLSREPQEDNIYYPSDFSSAETAVKLSNIELMEDENDDTYRENFIIGIYDNVLGTEYYLYELESYGIAFLNFGDIFTIKACNRENGEIGTEKEYKTIFMRTDMTVNGGIKEKSKLEAPQATSTEYESASTTDKTLKKTMLKVDKQNQRITSLAKESEERYTQLEQSVEGISTEIYDGENGLLAKLTATAEKADSAYSKAEQIEKYDYITSAEAESLISQSAESISLSVEKSLKIGARNILLNSACFESFTPHGYDGSEMMSFAGTDTAVPSGKFSRIMFPGYRDNDGNDGYSGFYIATSDVIGQENGSVDKIKPNTTYTLSFWLKDFLGTIGKLNHKALIYVGSKYVSYDLSRSNIPAPSREWQKYTFTFTTPATVERLYIRLFFSDCTVNEYCTAYISSFKLEEGNIATDWSPSAEDVEQSVNAKIDLCVKTNEDGKLVSKILIESNKLEINTDKFTLAEDGTMTCADATIEGTVICGDDQDNMTICNAKLIHTVLGNEIGRIGIGQDRFGNLSEVIRGTNSVTVAVGERAIEFDSDGSLHNGYKFKGTEVFAGYRHYRQFVTDTSLEVLTCATGIYSDKTLGVELYNPATQQIECALKVKRENYDTSTVTIYGTKQYGSDYITSPALSLRTDGLYYNGKKLAFE